MAALNFPDSPAIDEIFVAPNGVEYKYDGQAWNVLSAAAGVPGPQGEQGIQGVPGIQGETGPIGFHYAGRVNTVNDLASVLNIAELNDVYIANDTGIGYQCAPVSQSPNGKGWIDLGRLVGENGVDGQPGAQGEQGIQGIQGEKGDQGIPGLGITFKGRVATVGDLPATATQGDMYIVDATGDAWVWSDTAAAFENAGPIVGPTGSQGVPGEQGVPGATGPAGPSAVSKDAGNTAKLGTDSLIYVPSVTYTLPTASATVLGGVKVGAGLAIDGNGVLSANAAGSYVLKAGDAMTGALRYSPMSPPSTYNGSDWYQWHNTGNNGLYFSTPTGKNFLFGSDGTLNLGAAPTAAMHAATKAYVDGLVGGGGSTDLPLAGGTMTGTITLPTTIQSFLWGASTYNMFGANGGVAVRYGTANIVNFTASGTTFYQKITTPATGQGVEFGSGGAYLSKVGTGIGVYAGGQQRWTFDSTKHKSLVPVELPADPVNALEAATKQYVDAKIVPIAAGGTAPAAASYPEGALLVEYL